MGQVAKDFAELTLTNEEIQAFRKKTFLVTGATGFIGSMFVRSLIYLSNVYNLEINVIILVRNKEKAQKILAEASVYNNLIISLWEASIPITVDGNVDYILHTVSVTNSRIMVDKPVDTIQTSLCGTNHVLKFAAAKNAKMIYLSSMEVYGQVNFANRDVVESDLGYIDLTKVRSDYCESKRLCESLCAAYNSQYGVNVVIARLAQTFGAGILADENRVFAQFAYSVIQGKNIILHTKGYSEGNYCYISDVISALLLLFIKGVSASTYNISNEICHRSIYQMAELVAQNFGHGKSKVVIDIPKNLENMGYAEDVKMRLSSAKLRALGWCPKVDMKEAYRRMITYLQEVNMMNPIN